MRLTSFRKLVSIANYNLNSRSTKKRSVRNKRNTLPQETNAPQGLKPASVLSADGTVDSRALPNPIRDSANPVGELPQPVCASTSSPPEGRNRKPRAESRKPEVVAVADRLHSAAIHMLRRVRKQDVA